MEKKVFFGKNQVYASLRWIVFSLVVFYFGERLIESWHQQKAVLKDIDMAGFFFSMMILSFGFFLLPLASGQTAAVFSQKISLLKSCQGYFYAQTGKYLPGGIWTYVGRVYLFNQQGLKKGMALSITMLELLLLTVSGFISFLASLPFWRHPPDFTADLLLSGLGFSIFIFFLAFVYEKKRPSSAFKTLQSSVKANLKAISFIFLLYLCFWALVGLGFYLMADAMLSIPVKMLLVLWGLYPLVWIFGKAVFFVPAGIGVREGALVYFLNYYMLPDQSVWVSVISRFWWVLAELFCLVVVFTWSALCRNK